MNINQYLLLKKIMLHMLLFNIISLQFHQTLNSFDHRFPYLKLCPTKPAFSATVKGMTMM